MNLPHKIDCKHFQQKLGSFYNCILYVEYTRGICCHIKELGLNAITKLFVGYIVSLYNEFICRLNNILFIVVYMFHYYVYIQDIQSTRLNCIKLRFGSSCSVIV